MSLWLIIAVCMNFLFVATGIVTWVAILFKNDILKNFIERIKSFWTAKRLLKVISESEYVSGGTLKHDTFGEINVSYEHKEFVEKDGYACISIPKLGFTMRLKNKHFNYIPKLIKSQSYNFRIDENKLIRKPNHYKSMVVQMSEEQRGQMTLELCLRKIPHKLLKEYKNSNKTETTSLRIIFPQKYEAEFVKHKLKID